uniref:Ig-like domain-containing protein n=1 Tax=Salarias fasciatus TaxID=181472 RepID=A0A672I9Y9_SALFA
CGEISCIFGFHVVTTDFFSGLMALKEKPNSRSPQDSGVITCRATNKFGVDQTSATLIVKDEKGLVEETQLPEGRVHRIDEMERMAHEGGPYGVTTDEETEKVKPEIVLVPEPTRVLEGDIARFRCRVTGYPAPKVNWYLNGQLIRKSKRYRLRYDGIYYLEIVDIKSYDAGEVRVVADNPLGTTEYTVKLEIQQKEDFRSVLRRAPEPKAAEVSHDSGRMGFDSRQATPSCSSKVSETHTALHVLLIDCVQYQSHGSCISEGQPHKKQPLGRMDSAPQQM